MRKRPSKKRDERKKQEQKGRLDDLQMPDRRGMEKMMSDLGRLLSQQEFESEEEANSFLQNLLGSGGMLQGAASDAPLDQAQDLMYEAFEARDPKRRIQLARQALEISPDCADAYVLLSQEEARSLEKARQYFEEGVEAGERALGADFFEENEGYFWGILETRPYMRAREGLAHVLWQLDEYEAAIAHLQAMLRLNPGDNQGVRYTLAGWLLEADQDEELGALLKEYEDDAMAAWVYTRALWLFRQHGPSPEADRALQEALDQNPHVPAYLTGKKKLPRRLPDYHGWGDENEAILYVVEGASNWLRTHGALRWLKQHAGRTP